MKELFIKQLISLSEHTLKKAKKFHQPVSGHSFLEFVCYSLHWQPLKREKKKKKLSLVSIMTLYLMVNWWKSVHLVKKKFSSTLIPQAPHMCIDVWKIVEWCKLYSFIHLNLHIWSLTTSLFLLNMTKWLAGKISSLNKEVIAETNVRFVEFRKIIFFVSLKKLNKIYQAKRRLFKKLIKFW